MISTHSRERHYPSEGKLNLFDALVRQIADLLEQQETQARQGQIWKKQNYYTI